MVSLHCYTGQKRINHCPEDQDQSEFTIAYTEELINHCPVGAMVSLFDLDPR